MLWSDLLKQQESILHRSMDRKSEVRVPLLLSHDEGSQLPINFFLYLYTEERVLGDPLLRTLILFVTPLPFQPAQHPKAPHPST